MKWLSYLVWVIYFLLFQKDKKLVNLFSMLVLKRMSDKMNGVETEKGRGIYGYI